MPVTVTRVRQNPFDWAVRHLGMTRAQFGLKADLGKPYLLRLTQGRHARISEYTLSWLYKIAKEKGIDLDEDVLIEYGAEDLETAWDEWVVEHRKHQQIPDPAPGRGHPFGRVVKAAGGVARMAALLAVPDPLVERYAKGLTPRMPAPIRTALRQMGYPHLDALDEGVQKWVSKKSS